MSLKLLLVMPAFRLKISLFINYFLFAILLNSAGTVILQVQHYFGSLESEASLIELCKDFGLAITSFLVAGFVTRIGYKNSMLIALSLVAGTCFVLPSLQVLVAIKMLFAITGACFALIKISVFGCIGLVARSEKEHISLMNFIESFFMAGIFAGYFIFSRFMSDSQPTSPGWFNVYYLLGGFAVLAGGLLWTTPVDESAARTVPVRETAGGFPSLFHLVMMPLVASFVLCSFLYVLVEQSIMSWLPTYNNKVLGIPAVLSVQVTSTLAAATALGRFMAALVLKRCNWFTVLTACLSAAALLVIIGLLISGVESRPVTGWFNIPAAALVFPLIGFFLAPIYPAINSVVLASLPKPGHGMMSGVIVIFSALGGSFGSVVTGYLFQYYGGKTAFYFPLLAMTLLVLSFFAFEKIRSNRNVMSKGMKVEMASP